MIAFSPIPPLNQQHQTIELQFPLQNIIEVDSIDQTNRSTKSIVKHVISIPNQLVRSVKTTVEQRNGNDTKVDNSVEQQIGQKLLDEDNVVKNLEAGENVQMKKQTTEFSLFACKELPQQQSEQIIPLSSDKSIIKRLFTTPPVSEKPLPPTVFIQNHQKEHQFREQTHIMFSSPSTINNINNLVFTKRPAIFTKQLSPKMNNLLQGTLVESVIKQNQRQCVRRPVIFTKQLPVDSQLQGTLVESIVKQHEMQYEQQHENQQPQQQKQSQQQKQHQIINSNILQNLNNFINQDQTNVQSHIQCSFFNNSITKPQKSLFHRPNSHDLYNSVQRTSIDSGPKQKHRQIFDKADKQTTDRELYESYHRNKDRVKQLGGKRLEDAKKNNKISLKSLRLQLTKLINISPSVI